MGAHLRTSELKAAYPDQPWMWKPDWADRCIANILGKFQLIVVACFAVVVNLVGTPAGIAAVCEWHFRHRPWAWIGGAFPLVGLGLLIWVMRLAMRGLRYGKSVFRLETLPAVAGSALAGTICISKAVDLSSGVRLRLRCMRQDSVRTSRGSDAIQIAVWEAEQRLTGLPVSTNGTEIPVYFDIPGNAKACDDGEDGTEHYWQVEAMAGLRDSYKSMFIVPVYSAAVAALPKQPIVDRAAAYRELERDIREPEDHGIAFRPLAGGGCEIHYRAARNVNQGVGAAGFMLVWTVAGVFMVEWGAPIFFSILSALIVGISAIAAVRLFLLSLTVTANSDGINVESAMLGFHRGRFIPAGELTQIRAVITVQDNRSGAVDYKIRAQTRHGEQCVSNLIRGQRDADWLADEMITAVRMDRIPS